MHPINDKVKIEVSVNEYGFGEESVGVEKGIVVEVPDTLIYFGFHSSFADTSLANNDILAKTQEYYNQFKGKIVFWESLQDRGRRFKENGKDYVFLNMSDIIAYSDDTNIKVEAVDQVGKAGSFNLS